MGDGDSQKRRKGRLKGSADTLVSLPYDLYERMNAVIAYTAPYTGMVHKSAFIRAAISAWCIDLEARYNGGKQWPAVPSGQPEPPLGQLAADADTVHSVDEPPSQLGLSFDDAGTGLDERLSAFIDTQIASGRYRSADEVVSAALRMLEDRETEMHALRQHVDISGGLMPQGRQAALALRALMANDPDGSVHETTVNAMWAARHDPPGA